VVPSRPIDQDDGVAQSHGWMSRWRTTHAGLRPLMTLVWSHGLAAAADAFVTVSLAGSLFFSLSPRASRSQVLLYLSITMVPFILLAPLIGPAVDRFRSGRRVVGAIAYGLQAACCLGLAASLYEIRFYVFALALLMTGKASSVVLHALVPHVIEDPRAFVAANSRLANVATIGGAIGASAGALVLRFIDPPAALLTAAVLFAGAALFMARVPTARTYAAPTAVEFAELHEPSLVLGAGVMIVVRAGVGYFVFMLAFGLRRASEPVWVYAAAAFAYGAGSFIGNVMAPWMRRRFHDERLLEVALGAPAIACAFAVVGVSRPMITLIAAVIGVSGSLARRAFDSLLQRTAPDALRGRMFARYETWFQLGWVAGALVATAITLPTSVSMGFLTALFVPAMALYLRSARAAGRVHAVIAPEPGRPSFGLDRLRAAEQWHRLGHSRMAIVEAAATGDVVRVQTLLADEPRAITERLDALRFRAVDVTMVVLAEDADEALALARLLVPTSTNGTHPPDGDDPHEPIAGANGTDTDGTGDAPGDAPERATGTSG
jgi:MFS family permease